jgi:hypothetical protein
MDTSPGASAGSMNESSCSPAGAEVSLLTVPEANTVVTVCKVSLEFLYNRRCSNVDYELPLWLENNQ